jgi:dCTP deaminase
MATKVYYFSGKIEWAKRQKDDRYNNWTINLYPDEASEKSIEESGCASNPKLNKATKEMFYTFRRPESKLIKGETVTFGPPKFLILKDGQTVEFDGIIGNGSTGKVKVSVYDIPATGGKGTRYEAVLVEDLVPYNPPPAGGTTPPSLLRCPCWRNTVAASVLMIASAQTLRRLRPVEPFEERSKSGGMSFGLSSAGYDVRIAEKTILLCDVFKLASTVEHFKMPSNLLGVVHDKSTWARRGLSVFNTVIEPGWEGYLTLELVNHGRDWLTIEAGSPIAQIVFHYLDEATDQPYNGKYQHQAAGPQAARFD